MIPRDGNGFSYHDNDSCAMKSNKISDRVVHAKVSDALSSLEEVKQDILKRRFGLEGEPAMSYREIAYYLTSQLPPEIKLQIVTMQREAHDEITLEAEDIKTLEAEALRELSRGAKRPTLLI